MLNQLTQAVAFPSNHNPSHTEAAADAASLTLCAAAMFAFERGGFDSFAALRTDLCRANPIDHCANYDQSDAGHRCAARRTNHRP